MSMYSCVINALVYLKVTILILKALLKIKID